MIELVIAACLMSGDCRETRLSFEARNVSLMTCLIAGQTAIAKWQSQNPDSKVKRWSCAVKRQSPMDFSGPPND
ncbi:MAG: hypothetical protein AAAB35_26810 [Phyllobacterium sp.]|uniref:hypothetical protein n=1 Tax=Phyllobacterium sp. TaxID=1871046 RepID=UPI0030EFC485